MVANEFYDAHGKFSQEAWARALLQTLKVGLCSRSCLSVAAVTYETLL